MKYGTESHKNTESENRLPRFCYTKSRNDKRDSPSLAEGVRGWVK
ncbi:hypothetical protein [Helicobacter sp. 23-1045]